MNGCPVCRTPNAVDAKFCNQCGHQLQKSEEQQSGNVAKGLDQAEQQQLIEADEPALTPRVLGLNRHLPTLSRPEENEGERSTPEAKTPDPKARAGAQKNAGCFTELIGWIVAMISFAVVKAFWQESDALRLGIGWFLLLIGFYALYWLGGFIAWRFFIKRQETWLVRVLLWSNTVAWFIPAIGFSVAGASHALIPLLTKRQRLFKTLTTASIVLGCINALYGGIANTISDKQVIEANSLIKNQKAAEAVSLLDTAVILNFISSDAYYARARAYMQLNQYTAALADINKAVDLWETDDKVYKDRAMIQFRIGNYEAALRDIDNYISSINNDASAYALSAVIKLKLNRREEAQADLQKAKDLGFSFKDTNE